MVNVLKKENWSDAFLLPLTGLRKNDKFDMHSHLFWNQYNIHDYKLILTFSSRNYQDLMEHCSRYVFPVLDKKGYLLENYDIQDKCIFILDMSEWAKDIEMFIMGKYSKFSKEAKGLIEKYHTYGKGDGQIQVHIMAALYPNLAMDILDKKTPIEYVSEEYGLNYEDMKRIGEIGSIYDAMSETLLTGIEGICQ